MLLHSPLAVKVVRAPKKVSQAVKKSKQMKSAVQINNNGTVANKKNHVSMPVKLSYRIMKTAESRLIHKQTWILMDQQLSLDITPTRKYKLPRHDSKS
jgi:hypothetical protein